MKLVQLGQSDLQVTPICLGTMTFGEQVDEPSTHRLLSSNMPHSTMPNSAFGLFCFCAGARSFGKVLV